MNAKELLEWLEERGELYICKANGGSYTVVARAADGVLKTAEAATLVAAVLMWEECDEYPLP